MVLFEAPALPAVSALVIDSVVSFKIIPEMRDQTLMPSNKIDDW